MFFGWTSQILLTSDTFLKGTTFLQIVVISKLRISFTKMISEIEMGTWLLKEQ